MINVAMTGASGNMGRAAVQKIMELSFINKLTVLFLEEKREKKLYKKWKKLYGDKIDFVWGTVANKQNCEKLIENADYVLHLAAVIPPKADHFFDKAEECNDVGTKTLVNVIEHAEKQPAFIHISTVAIYGNRNYKHPWGRVGDPLIPSAYDVYSVTKLCGERAVISSQIKKWAVLRQTGILHENLLSDNVKDGLLFHTTFNGTIEWVTADDSGVLLKNILLSDAISSINGSGASQKEKDFAIKLNVKDFWKNVYNIGGGAPNRITGYETFAEGFGVIGVTPEAFMNPKWNETRNFHCLWFADSDELERRFCFRSGDIHGFWQGIKAKHPEFAAAKILPAKLLSAMVLKPLLKDDNAPVYWAEHGQDGRVIAAYGSREAYEILSEKWEDFPLLCKGELPDGTNCDYNIMKNIAAAPSYSLNHGYDESKPFSEWTIDDVRAAAIFRGGKLITENMQKGDVYSPLEWENAYGERFILSAFAVMRAGHWDSEAELAASWDFDRLAKNNPFYAQVYYDSRKKDENMRYFFNGKVPEYEKY